MNIIYLLTTRYISGSRVLGFLSIKSRLSFLVMTVGVALLIVVLSIFNGFQKQVKESLWAGGAHITIENNFGSGEIRNYTHFIEKLKENSVLREKIITVQGNITSHGLLQNYGSFIPVMIKALPTGNTLEFYKDPSSGFPMLTHFDRKEITQMSERKYVIVGKEMASLYDISLGNPLTIAVPAGRFTVGQGVEVNNDTFRASGYFKTGYYNFDSRFIFMSLPVAQRLFRLGSSVNQISIRVKRLGDLAECKDAVYDVIAEEKLDEIQGANYSVRTIAEEQENFLAALQLEKTIISVIVFLFIILAALGMVATVYSLVRSKRKSIGTLKALGLSSDRIMMIFTLNAMIIGILASLVGGMVGIFLANHLEVIIDSLGEVINAFGHVFYGLEWRDIELVPKDIYYFDHIPVDIDISFIFMVTTAATILSGLAGYFPARWAARLNPVDTIRND